MLSHQVSAGEPGPNTVQMKITDDEGKPLPRDGVAFGHLKVTGPWVCARYYNEPAGSAAAAT